MRTKVFIVSILMISGCQPSTLLKLEVGKRDSGWFYIAPISKTTSKRQVSMIFDENGVLYFSSKKLKDVKKIKVYARGVDITDSLKHFRLIADTFTNGDGDHKYKIYSFYYPGSGNSNNCDDPNLNCRDNSEYVLIEMKNRESLLEQGKIKF